MKPGAVLALVLLAGCASASAVSPPRQGVSFVPDGNGLGVSGRAERLDFGRAPSGMIPVLDRELGSGQTLALTGCPAGIWRQIAWGDLVLTFTSERFVGWARDGAQAGQTCS